jgi:hypothetical protein
VRRVPAGGKVNPFRRRENDILTRQLRRNRAQVAVGRIAITRLNACKFIFSRERMKNITIFYR